MWTLEQPSMALNDERHHLIVQMWNTWKVRASDTRSHIIGWVSVVARGAPGGRLKNVVFSCHGNPSYLQMGEGFNRTNAWIFRGWAGLVERIWFRSCSVAFIQTAGAAVTGDGNLFCSEVARAAQCSVVASTETQWATSNRTLPYGQIDIFEGLVLDYGADGAVHWSQRYPSQWQSEWE